MHHFLLRIFFASSILISILPFSRATAQVVPDSVTIIRDTYGVPHIYGPRDADVAYVL